MAQPNSDPKIVSPPAPPGMPYNPVDDDGSTSPWVKLTANSGPASINTGQVNGVFPDSGVWQQV